MFEPESVTTNIVSIFKECPAVYIFTNKINGKVYVGETMNLRHRMYAYITPKPIRAFTNALIKYGLEGFHLEYYYLPDFNKEDLLGLEEQMISQFKSLTSQHGYNICARGNNNTGRIQTEEAKRKISEYQTGRKRSEETKLKMSKAKKGRTFSEEAKRKMSEAGMKRPPNRKGAKHSEETKRKMKETRNRKNAIHEY